MKARPMNPSESRRREAPVELRSKDGDNRGNSEKTQRDNPWKHDLELINVLQGTGRAAARDVDPKKLLDALEGKFDEEKVSLKLPGIVKDPAAEALKSHPLNIDQQKYLASNLRRFKKKADKEKAASGGSKKSLGADASANEPLDTKNPVFFRAVSELPETKQRALLQTLSKIAKSLEFGGLSTEEDASTAVTSTSKSASMMDRLQRLEHSGGDDDMSVVSMLSQGGRSQASSHVSGSTGTQSYSTATQYGKSSVDSYDKEAAAILNRIGHGMHLNPENEFKYHGALGRGPNKASDLVPPTEIMAVMATEFRVKLSTGDIEAVMHKFDTDKLGLVSLGALLGSAKLAYSKTAFRNQMAELNIVQQDQRKELAQRRAEYREKLGGKSLDGSVVEGSMKRDAMKVIIEKVAQAAYVAVRGKALKPLNIVRAQISSKEYRQLLKDLDCELLPRELAMLERRYYIASCGMIDTEAFKLEFLALGKDIIRERMRAEALQSFLKTLAKSNPDKAIDISNLSAGAGQNPSSISASSHTSGAHAKGGHSSDSSSATKTNADRAKSLNEAIASNNIKPVAVSHYSLDSAEEWIADPLTSPSKKASRKGGLVKSSKGGTSNLTTTLTDGSDEVSLKESMIADLVASEANIGSSAGSNGDSLRSLAHEMSDDMGPGAGDELSLDGMSSLTSRSQSSNVLLQRSESTVNRQKKREEFMQTVDKNERRESSSSSSSKGGGVGAVAAVQGGSQSLAADAVSNDNSCLSDVHSVASIGQFRAQMTIDIGRENPSSSTFEEHIGSMEVPFELELTQSALTTHDEHSISGGSAVSGSFSLVPTIRDVSAVRSSNGMRPTTREQKLAIEAQRKEEDALQQVEETLRRSELTRRKEEEYKRIVQEERDIEERAQAAATARVARQKEMEEMEALAAESARQQEVQEAERREAEAQAAAKAAVVKAATEKSAAARTAAIRAMQEQEAAVAATKAAQEKAAADRELASRPPTRELPRPPSSPVHASPTRPLTRERREARESVQQQRTASSPIAKNREGEETKKRLSPGPAPSSTKSAAQAASTAYPTQIPLAASRAKPVTPNSDSIARKDIKPQTQSPQAALSLDETRRVSPEKKKSKGKEAPAPRAPASPGPSGSTTSYEINAAYRKADLKSQLVLVDQLEEAHSVDLPALSDAYYVVGDMRLAAGQPLDALAAYERSYRLREIKDPVVASTRLKQLALLAAALEGLEQKALRLATELLEHAEAQFGEDGTDFARVCFAVAEIKVGLCLESEALGLLEKAVAVFGENLGEEHEETANARSALQLLLGGGSSASTDIPAAAADASVSGADDTYVDDAAAASYPPVEEFELHGEAWVAYETSSKGANGSDSLHVYYSAYLGGQEHTQWEDPRVEGIVGFNGDQSSSSVYENEHEGQGNALGDDGHYDMGMYSLDVTHAGDRWKTERDGDASVLMASVDDAHWQKRRMQEEVTAMLGDGDQLGGEDDDDVLNASLMDESHLSPHKRVFAIKSAIKI